MTFDSKLTDAVGAADGPRVGDIDGGAPGQGGDRVAAHHLRAAE